MHDLVHDYTKSYKSTVRKTSISRHKGAPFKTPIKAPLKLLNVVVLWWSEGFQEDHQFSPHDAKKP